jgi:imidazoleglycerol phosphate synthase glutamine amidotransferase subunit HisH
MHFDRPDVKVVKSTGPSLPAVVLSGRTIGVQFHPEKSQASGRRFMQNVLDYVAR